MLHTLKEQIRSLRGSLIRAVVFGFSWALLPFWLFTIIALLLFLLPLHQARRVAVPFVVLIGLAGFTPHGAIMAAIFGILFWYIVLIKEFYVIDRRTAYEILAFSLVFLAFRFFYMGVGAHFVEGGVIALALIPAAVAAVLFSSFVGGFAEEQGLVGEAAARTGYLERSDLSNADQIGRIDRGERTDPAIVYSARYLEGRLLRRIAGFVIFFILLETLFAGLFLPLNFAYQTAVAFIIAVLLMDLAGRYLLDSRIDRFRVLMLASTATGLLVLVLGSARWTF